MIIEGINFYLFILYIYGLGYSLTRFIKNNTLETTIMRLGIGLGAFPLLGVILNTFRIPLDWKIFFILAILLPLYDFLNYIKSQKSYITLKRPSRRQVILIVIFIAFLLLYCIGSFMYPWLEDDDPWQHAASIKYIAIEKDLNAAQGVFQYLNPYPPGYDIIFAVLHQTSPSLYWTLKFFNALIIALGILFFYYFAKEFTRNENKALWATFFLAIIPCYLSHFIWAHALVVTLFFPSLYAILKSKDDKRFITPAVVVTAAIFIVQPTQSIKYVIMLILYGLSLLIINKKIPKKLITIIILGVIVSLAWWGPIISRYVAGSLTITSRTNSVDYSASKETTSQLIKYFTDPAAGTATKAYSWQEYFSSPKPNWINNPIGVGGMLCILYPIGMICLLFSLLKKRREKDKETNQTKIYSLSILLWSVFFFLGMNSKTFNLPVGLFAFRFWMLFAISVAFFAAESISLFMNFIKTPKMRIAIAILIILSVVQTSGLPKLKINKGLWSWGVDWGSPEELKVYMSLRQNLKPNIKVFSFTDNLFVIGHDMHADFWSKNYKESFDNALDLDIKELHARLKKNHFEYIIIGRREVQKLGLEAVNSKLESIEGSGLFKISYNIENGAVVYKVL